MKLPKTGQMTKCSTQSVIKGLLETGLFNLTVGENCRNLGILLLRGGAAGSSSGS